MDLYINAKNTTYQDSTNRVDNQQLPLRKDSIVIETRQPSTLSIPETPKRFIKSTKTKTVKSQVFYASPDDSVTFNLITRKQENSGIIKKNIVDDFLSPIPLSDRTWINQDTQILKEERDQALLYDSLKTEKSDPLKTPLVQFIDTTKVDSPVITPETTSCKDTLPKIQSTETQHIEVEPKQIIDQNWNRDILTGLILLSVAIIGFLRVTNFKYLRDLFSSLIFTQNARKMLKTVNLHYQKPAFILNGLFLFNSAIFIYQLLNYYQVKSIAEQKLVMIPIIMGLILVFGLVKIAIYRFVAFIFETVPETKEYLFFSFLHNKVFAIAILPINLVLPYITTEAIPGVIYLGISIYILLYLMQLFRGIAIILKNLASLFYLFLYLCALEILPIIIIYKILIK